MGSEQSWNKTNDGTSFQPSEPALCANGCGFFGSAATMNLCSKCYRDLRIEEEAKTAMEKSLNATSSSSLSFVKQNLILPKNIESLVGPSSSSSSSSSELSSAIKTSVAAPGEGGESKGSSRCGSCERKVGLTGFKCRCGSTFCGTHRYPEKHDCTFDFKGTGRDAIAKANPVVKADKVDRF